MRVPIKGVVTEFVWSNPHSQIYLDVKDKNGNPVTWPWSFEQFESDMRRPQLEDFELIA